MATISRLFKIISLFCRMSSLLLGFFAKETYNFKEPTYRSHPIGRRFKDKETHTYIPAYPQTCQHAYIHTYIQTYSMHTYIHTYIHANIHTYIHTCRHTHKQSNIHTCIHKYIGSQIWCIPEYTDNNHPVRYMGWLRLVGSLK